jgi:hypothetical protein
MSPELLATDPLTATLESLLSWLSLLITWMGGVLVALPALGVILYAALLWEQRAEHRSRRSDARHHRSRISPPIGGRFERQIQDSGELSRVAALSRRAPPAANANQHQPTSAKQPHENQLRPSGLEVRCSVP